LNIAGVEKTNIEEMIVIVVLKKQKIVFVGVDLGFWTSQGIQLALKMVRVFQQ